MANEEKTGKVILVGYGAVLPLCSWNTFGGLVWRRGSAANL